MSRVEDWDIDLVVLRALQLIDEQGSISKVAKNVGVSQQALSSRIARFEKKVAVDLLSRDHRGARLTEVGSTLVERSQLLLLEVTKLEHFLSLLQRDAGNVLEISASMTIAEYLLPLWLNQWRNINSENIVKTKLAIENSTQVVQRVRRGEVELGFIESPEIPPDLSAQILGEDEVIIVVEPGHSWASRAVAVTDKEIEKTAFMMRELGSGTRQAWQQALENRGIPLNLAQEMPTIGSLKTMVSQPGSAPAVVSRRTILDELIQGKLVEVCLETLRPSRPLTIVWDKEKKLSQEAISLLNCILDTNK